MLLENQVYNRSICKFVNDKSIQWNDFKNKRFLISGATGLIGATLVNSILVANHANYAQTECQFRYCGTAIPFLTVRSTAR